MFKNENMEHDDDESVIRQTDDHNHSYQIHRNRQDINGLLVDLQKHWLSEFQCSREKVLVEMTEKLEHEFLCDQQKIRTELLTEFKQELDNVRTALEDHYREILNQKLLEMNTAHRRELSAIKKKQWCWRCEEEASLFCCWNISYCSEKCQHDHWKIHRKYCKRNKNGSKDGGAKPSNATDGTANDNASATN